VKGVPVQRFWRDPPYPRYRMSDRPTPEKLFLDHLGWIDRAAAFVCGKYRLSDAEAEDFSSWIRARLMEDDYAVFRGFRGEAKLKTYLTVVVSRQFHEYRRQLRGRWRTSTAALRLGSPAPELEELVHRDGYSLRQAGEKLRTAGQTTQSDTELARLFAKLPPRAPLRPVEVSSEAKVDAAEGTFRADERVTAAEDEEERERVRRALAQAMARLNPEDQLIVRMHILDGHTLAHVARALNLEQKPLYRRIERLRTQLRAYVEEEGVQSGDVHGVMWDQEDS
jgi:RNA polymerase sigma factor (sigma-70 family)